MKVHFNWVGVKATKRFKDENGKSRQITKHFRQTLNPFNKNADGTMKTRDQIMAEEIANRNAWLNVKEPSNA
jgi:hypothetical protein